jgi:predicted RNA-binding protein
LNEFYFKNKIKLTKIFIKLTNFKDKIQMIENHKRIIKMFFLRTELPRKTMQHENLTVVTHKA